MPKNRAFRGHLVPKKIRKMLKKIRRMPRKVRGMPRKVRQMPKKVRRGHQDGRDAPAAAPAFLADEMV